MNELNKVRGFMVPVSQNEKPGQSPSGLKYFVLGPDSTFYTTSNLALLQFLFSHSENIERLLENCQRHLNKMRFAERPQVGPIQDYPQPETLPFFNQKYFSGTLRVWPDKTDAEGGQSEPREKAFSFFALDDEVLIPLHAFFTAYPEFAKSAKRRAEFLGTRLELYNHEEDLNSMETLNYKKHLDNYKMKMRLLIQKMEQDERELAEGVGVVPREVVDDSGPAEDKSSKLVKLNNGSLFAGALKNNRPDGNGKEFLPDGSSYVGDFKNGFWHGSGYLVDSENYICYGEFYEGRVVGI